MLMPFICYECRKPLPPVALTNNNKAVCDMCHAMLETKLMLKRWEDGLCSKCGYQTYGAKCLQCYVTNLRREIKNDANEIRDVCIVAIAGMISISVAVFGTGWFT